MREPIAGVPACIHARFICEEEPLAFHGPTLLATRQRSLASDHRRRCRSGLWCRLGHVDDLLVAIYHLRGRV